MRGKANLVAYIGLTLLAMLALADRIAPYRGPVAACTLGYVYDGDTVEMRCDGTLLRARLLGFDAPEASAPKCASEAAWAARATARLRELLRGPKVEIYRHGRDKYRRELVQITVAGRDVAEVMIAEGLAVAYAGGKRRSWCGGQ